MVVVEHQPQKAPDKVVREPGGGCHLFAPIFGEVWYMDEVVNHGRGTQTANESSVAVFGAILYGFEFCQNGHALIAC